MKTTPHNRAGAATLAILTALTLSVGAPGIADAKMMGIDGPAIAKIKDGLVSVALVAPGQPPLPCTPGRYKCPLGGGLL